MIFEYPKSIYVSLFIGSAYQIVLKKTFLEEWILRDDFFNRIGFLDQNREGIFSLFGYIFLYSLGLIYAKFSSICLFRYY